jgi:hypothetical protein
MKNGLISSRLLNKIILKLHKLILIYFFQNKYLKGEETHDLKHDIIFYCNGA